MTENIIRTSDRNLFRKCRVAWDFGSKIRMNYTYGAGIEPLDFGTAIHAGLEIIYDPNRQNDPNEIKQAEALAAFMDSMQDWKIRLKAHDQWETNKDKWKELIALGRGMLRHYLQWAEEHDNNWDPIHTEIEFEVPIPVPDHLIVRIESVSDIAVEFAALRIDGLEGHYLHILDYDTNEWIPVYYQGRIDLIVQNLDTGKYWIVDHKTTSQFGDTEWLELDPQASGYFWVAKRMLKTDVEGVIFNFLRKKVPSKPAMLKNGKLSKAMGQDTTKEMYIQTIEEFGFPMHEYVSFLNAFVGKQYFKREETFRSEDELDSIGQNILFEAIDMLNDPLIYPNPTQMNCPRCRFKAVCKMRQDDSDWVWFLESSGNYVKNT